MVAAIAYSTGFSGWAAIGLGFACFVLAQVLYVFWIAGMARTEARRRKTDASGPDSAHSGQSKAAQQIVQKG